MLTQKLYFSLILKCLHFLWWFPFSSFGWPGNALGVSRRSWQAGLSWWGCCLCYPDVFPFSGILNFHSTVFHGHILLYYSRTLATSYRYIRAKILHKRPKSAAVWKRLFVFSPIFYCILKKMQKYFARPSDLFFFFFNFLKICQNSNFHVKILTCFLRIRLLFFKFSFIFGNKNKI